RQFRTDGGKDRSPNPPDVEVLGVTFAVGILDPFRPGLKLCAEAEVDLVVDPGDRLAARRRRPRHQEYEKEKERPHKIAPHRCFHGGTKSHAVYPVKYFEWGGLLPEISLWILRISRGAFGGGARQGRWRRGFSSPSRGRGRGRRVPSASTGRLHVRRR